MIDHLCDALLIMYTAIRHHPSDSSEANVPSDHHFIAVEVDGLHRKCNICLKKVTYLKSTFNSVY